MKKFDEETLEQVVSQMMKGHPLKKDVEAYNDCVRSMVHLVKYCSKCRKCGCESCSYVHVLKYVVRHQKPAYWWGKGGQAAVMGAGRMLKKS